MGHRFSDKEKISPIEPPCRKTIYNSLEEAQDAIKYITENRVVRKISTYKCNICGFWHLTSKSD